SSELAARLLFQRRSVFHGCGMGVTINSHGEDLLSRFIHSTVTEERSRQATVSSSEFKVSGSHSKRETRNPKLRSGYSHGAKISMGRQRAGASDFFKKFHILSVAWQLFHDLVELFGHKRRRFFAYHLRIGFVELGVFKDLADCLTKDLNACLGNTWRGDEGGAGHHEGAIYLEQSPLFVRFGKGFDFWHMSEARMFSLFRNL